MRKWIAGGDAPDIVASTVVKAATDATPRRRYTAGKQAGQVRFLRRFLPEVHARQEPAQIQRTAGLKQA